MYTGVLTYAIDILTTNKRHDMLELLADWGPDSYKMKVKRNGRQSGVLASTSSHYEQTETETESETETCCLRSFQL